MIGRVSIVFRLRCDLQRLCIHTAIAPLRFSLALRPSAHSNLWIAHRPRCAARQYAPTVLAIEMLTASLIGRVSIVFRLLCDLQRLCIHTAIASLRFSLALRPSAHSNLWIAHHPRCAACSDLSIAFQPLALYGQAHAFYPSARSPPALRGASACLDYGNLTVQPMVGRISIAFKLHAIGVCPQRLRHCISA